MSKEKGSRIKLTPAQTQEHILQYIENCEVQMKRGDRPSAICIEGKAGIAKTSLMKQIAKQTGYSFHQINTAMIDDLGHLTGFPEKEFRFKDHDGNYKWVPAEFSDDASKTAVFTGETRMAYAVPHWLKNVNPEEKFMLLLDDFTRGLPMVMQACMTLVEEYRYGSWELPKNTIIVLTTNPDNGEYSVASLDGAQKTRMRYIEMIFDVQSWAQWAESVNLDGRCINFVLNNAELFSEKHDGIGGSKDYNARSMTKFFNDIGCLKDFSANLSYVKVSGDGAVGNAFTDHFISFVNNKLDQLPHPKDLLKMESKEALNILNKVCGNFTTKDAYNPATASIMASRITNYVIYGTHDKWGKDENQQIINMILHNCFSDDLKFFMARQFMTPKAKEQSDKLQNITIHPEILKRIIA